MNKSGKLAPSLFAANFSNLSKDITILEAEGADYLHIDVMDGQFVPNLSLGPQLLQSIRDNCGMVFDVHLMVINPERFIPEFVKCGADIITIHIEATEDVEKCIKIIKDNGARACIAIKPATKIEMLLPYINELDMILIMSVEPGFGGQSFIESSIDRIKEIRNILIENDLDCDIEVDGGINKDNINRVLEAGANVIVVGSALFKGDTAKNTRVFIEKIKEGGKDI